MADLPKLPVPYTMMRQMFEKAAKAKAAARASAKVVSMDGKDVVFVHPDYPDYGFSVPSGKYSREEVYAKMSEYMKSKPDVFGPKDTASAETVVAQGDVEQLDVKKPYLKPGDYWDDETDEVVRVLEDQTHIRAKTLEELPAMLAEFRAGQAPSVVTSSKTESLNNAVPMSYFGDGPSVKYIDFPSVNIAQEYPGMGIMFGSKPPAAARVRTTKLESGGRPTTVLVEGAQKYLQDMEAAGRLDPKHEWHVIDALFQRWLTNTPTILRDTPFIFSDGLQRNNSLGEFFADYSKQSDGFIEIDRTALLKPYNLRWVQTTAHEIFHRYTVMDMLQDANVATAWEERRRSSQFFAATHGGDTSAYGFTNAAEFAAEAISNAQFRRSLQMMPGISNQNKTMYDEVLTLMSKYFGYAGVTTLTAAQVAELEKFLTDKPSEMSDGT